MGPAARLRRHALTFGVLAVAAALYAAAAQAAPPAPRPFGCLIEPDRVADVGSQVVGVVERLHVERGEMVGAGQTLVSLRADVERANANVAEVRARVDADVLAAQASLDLAEQKVRRAESLVQQAFLSDQALEQARAEHKLAEQKLAQARAQQQIWVQERRVAEAQVSLRNVRSPLNGVVVERYVNLGERVEERPLVRVAVIDPLRVELMVPTALYGRLAVGDSVTVRPELPNTAPVTARVRHIDPVMDAASNTFRVRLTLPNPKNGLPAGLRCKADLPEAAVPAAAVRTLPPSARAASIRQTSGAL